MSSKFFVASWIGSAIPASPARENNHNHSGRCPGGIQRHPGGIQRHKCIGPKGNFRLAILSPKSRFARWEAYRAEHVGRLVRGAKSMSAIRTIGLTHNLISGSLTRTPPRWQLQRQLQSTQNAPSGLRRVKAGRPISVAVRGFFALGALGNDDLG